MASPKDEYRRALGGDGAPPHYMLGGLRTPGVADACTGLGTRLVAHGGCLLALRPGRCRSALRSPWSNAGGGWLPVTGAVVGV